MYVDPDLVVPDDRLSLDEGAIAPWAHSSSQYYAQTLDSLAAHFEFSLTTAFASSQRRCARRSCTGPGTKR